MRMLFKITAACVTIGLSVSSLGYSYQASSVDRRAFDRIESIVNDSELESRKLTKEDLKYLKSEITNLIFERTDLDEDTIFQLTNKFMNVITAAQTGDAMAAYTAAKELNDMFKSLAIERGQLEGLFGDSQNLLANIFTGIINMIQAVLSGDLSGILQAVIGTIITFISLISG